MFRDWPYLYDGDVAYERRYLETYRTSPGAVLVGAFEGDRLVGAATGTPLAEHADEFAITASAPGAGAYDMSGVMAEVMLSGEEYPQPYYLPYVLFAIDEYYNLYDSPSDYLKEEYASSLPPLFDGTHSGSEINDVMPSVPLEILKPEIVEEFKDDDDHPLRQALRDNDLYDWTPKAPMRLFHSTGDDLVPIENAELAYDTFKKNGAKNVELYECDCGTHGEAAPILLFSGFAWIQSLTDKGQPLAVEGVTSPEEFSLLSVYPSPFNSGTNISLSLPSPSDVKLMVHDLLGKEIDTIHSGFLPAGQFRHSWDASPFAGGIYIVTAEWGSLGGRKERLSRKVLYLK